MTFGIFILPQAERQRWTKQLTTNAGSVRGRRNPPSLLMRLQTSFTTLENIAENPQNVINKSSHMPPTRQLLGIWLKDFVIQFHGYLPNRVHSFSIYNSQEIGTSRISFDWWMANKNLIYLHQGILFSWKEKWNHEVTDKWMKLENIIQSVVIQTQKVKCWRFSH